jgi:hypothetical protein
LAGTTTDLGSGPNDSSGAWSTGEFTFDDSYPSGGEAFTADDARLDDIKFVIFAPAGGYVFEFDYENDKIKAFQSVDPADSGGDDTPLVEVAATTDLSSVTTRWMAWATRP